MTNHVDDTKDGEDLLHDAMCYDEDYYPVCISSRDLARLHLLRTYLRCGCVRETTARMMDISPKNVSNRLREFRIPQVRQNHRHVLIDAVRGHLERLEAKYE